MTAKEALDKIKKDIKLFFGEEKPAEEQKFEAGKLKDGTAIEYSVLEAAGDIFIVDDKGAKTPAPVGDHELEDGTIIVVTEVGKIAEVKAAAAKEEQEMAEEEKPAPAKQEAPKLTDPVDWSDEIKWAKQAIASAAKQIAELQTAMQMFRDQTGEVINGLVAAFEAVASEGDEAPATKPRQTVFSDQTSKKDRAIQKMIDGAEAFRKRQEEQAK